MAEPLNDKWNEQLARRMQIWQQENEDISSAAPEERYKFFDQTAYTLAMLKAAQVAFEAGVRGGCMMPKQIRIVETCVYGELERNSLVYTFEAQRVDGQAPTLIDIQVQLTISNAAVRRPVDPIPDWASQSKLDAIVKALREQGIDTSDDDEYPF